MKYVTMMCLLCLSAPAAWSQFSEEDNELEKMKKRIGRLDSSFAEYGGIVDALQRIRVSGYLQPQFRSANLEGTVASASGGSFSQDVNKAFELRRGRIKVQYKDELTKIVFQIDGRQRNIIIKDAYGQIIEPWARAVGFQMGIFDRPFGFENAFSSGSRETPERARVVQFISPGERELGAKLFYAPQVGPLSFLRVDAGLFNGAGPLGSEFDNFKDFIGQVTVKIPTTGSSQLDLGVSAYLGNLRNATKYLWTLGTTSTGERGFVVDSSASNLDSGVPREFFGADGQFYFTMPALGATALRAEVIAGSQAGGSSAANPPDAFGTGLSTITPGGQPTGPIYRRDFIGWYINLVQNLGSSNQIVAKYDIYDPNTSVSGSDFTDTNNLSPADIKFETIGLGFIHHWNAHVKFVFYYEWISNETVSSSAASNAALAPFVNDLNDNIFTFRTQVKF